MKTTWQKIGLCSLLGAMIGIGINRTEAVLNGSEIVVSTILAILCIVNSYFLLEELFPRRRHE